MGYLLKTSLLLSMLLGILQSVEAANIKLATITNDDDAHTYVIGLKVDDQTKEVSSIYKLERDGEGKVISDLNFTPKQLEAGVTLVKRSGYDIVRLKGHNLNLTEGGDIDMIITEHALKKDHKTYDLKVERISDGKWNFIFQNKIVDKLHFITNKKFLIGAVGIKDIKIVK